MVTPLSPIVQTREWDITTIIPSVATTEGALAGQFSWGPIDERVLVDSENELVKEFHKPTNTNANDWWSAANFLAYTNKLYVVRVADIDNANTSLRAKNATASNSNGFLVKNDREYELNYADGSLGSTYGTGNWIAKYAGTLGNSLKVSICPSSAAYQSTLTGTVAVTANSTTVSGTSTLFTTQVTVGDLIVVNDETHKVASISSNTSLTLASRHVAGVTAGSTAVRRWEWYNEVDVAPGTSTYASDLGGSSDEMHIAVIDEDGAWTGQTNTVLEVFPMVSKAIDGKTIEGASAYYVNVVNAKSKYIRWAAHSGSITSIGSSAAGTSFGAYARPINNSLVGGSLGTTVGNDEKIRGYNLFRSPEDVDISFIIGSDATQTLATHLINNIAEVRKDCVVFLSPPRAYVVDNDGDEADDCVTYRNTLPSTSYASLDGNWKYQYDTYNDVYRYVPLNGDVAGLYARTDQERDPWWAAAGFNRGQIKNVIKLAWNPRLADRDILYKNGINPIATFPGDGTVLFGNKTLLAKPSAFDRVNVRRLFIVLEKAISRAAKYLLFEFNDDFTRATFRNMVNPYLRDIKGRRGVYDFLVVCDATNNTPEIIDSNQFIGDIYIKPARTAEFITLNFVAVRTGVEFNEVVGRIGS